MADNILRTYGDVSAREDVVKNAIEILTAKETQIYNKLGKTVAINTVHSYLVDTLLTAASLAVGEGDNFTPSTLTTPTRLTNLVEIVAKNFLVTRTQQDIQHYQGENELSRQTSKALMDWANAAEFDLVRSTLVSGASGTAPKMSKNLTQYIKFVMMALCQNAKIVVSNLGDIPIRNFVVESAIMPAV